MNEFMIAIRSYIQKHWLWLIANIGAVTPLLWLLWDYGTDNLSVNPIADITTRTGKPAIILLMLSLACTPLNIIFGWAKPVTVRKALGLYAFLYASLHFLTFVGLDYGFDLSLIFGDALLEKRYIVAGLAALILLIPLAITSTKGWMRRLGRNWKRLHQLVYVIGILAVAHFLWLVKAARLYEPLIYAVILSILLLVRVPPIRRFLTGLRRRTSTTQVHPAKHKSRPAAAPTVQQ